MKMHKKNEQIFVVEIYKTISHQNPEYIWEVFIKKDVPYNLNNELIMNYVRLECTKFVNSQRYGICYLSFRGSVLWNALSDEIKLATSINNFKKEIQQWNGRNCKC